MQHLLHTIRSQIKYKIILPYLVLMVLVMLAGSGIAIVLVADSWQNRFNNYLSQVARNFTGAFAQLEEANITYLWQIVASPANPDTNAPAIAMAMRNRDIVGLRQALEPYFRTGILNDELVLDRMIAFDMQGRALVDWEYQWRDGTTTTLESLDTDLSGLDLVQRVARGEADQIGDKYSALIRFQSRNTGGTTYFFTVVPVRVDNNVVGGVLLASRLDNLLQHLQVRSQSEITTLYDIQGRALGSTATNINLQSLDMPAAVIEDIVRINEAAATIQRDTTGVTPEPANSNRPRDPCFDIGNQPGGLINPLITQPLPACSTLDTVAITGRQYQFVYAPLLIRGVQTGYFSISLSRDFVVSAWSDSRWVIIAVTALLAVGAVLVGYGVARKITDPLGDLVLTAEAVTQGQLERRSTVSDTSELGKLSQAFNQMTEHLLRLYTTSRELNQSLEVAQVLEVATRSAQSFVLYTEVLALLKEGEHWLYQRRPSAPLLVQTLAAQPVPNNDALVRFLHQQPLSEVFLLNDPAVLQASELYRIAGFNSVLITPLLVHNHLQGVLLMAHQQEQAFGEADVQTLTVVAHMSVTVLQNAVLYKGVQRDAKERQAILTSIGDGVVVCDDQGRVVMVNRAAQEMLGWYDWRTTRYTIAKLPQEQVQVARELFGRSTNMEQYRIGDRVVSRSHAPVIAEDGRTTGTVIVLHDVTEAVAVDKAKTDFIATISHELRTPLTVIRGYVDLVLRGVGGSLTTDQTELLEQVRTRATDMTNMVNNAIMIADIESGKLITELQPQDVRVILESAVAPIRAGFAAKGLELSLPDLSSDMPLVMADREQLKLVFYHLLDNARRYTQRGGVTVSVHQDGESVRIDIEDTGPGIAADHLNRLFARFQRIEGNNSTERGGGLGLAITKQLIERQGGQIQASSTPGQGSVFSIILPQANEQTLAVAQSSSETTASR